MPIKTGQQCVFINHVSLTTQSSPHGCNILAWNRNHQFRRFPQLLALPGRGQQNREVPQSRCRKYFKFSHYGNGRGYDDRSLYLVRTCHFWQ